MRGTLWRVTVTPASGAEPAAHRDATRGSRTDASDAVEIAACGKCGEVQSEVQRTLSKMPKKRGK